MELEYSEEQVEQKKMIPNISRFFLKDLKEEENNKNDSGQKRKISLILRLKNFSDVSWNVHVRGSDELYLLF